MPRKIVPQIRDFETWFTQPPRSMRGKSPPPALSPTSMACADELRGAQCSLPLRVLGFGSLQDGMSGSAQLNAD
jgi:hypothetical protein